MCTYMLHAYVSIERTDECGSFYCHTNHSGDDNESDDDDDTGAIIAGVVVGVILIIAIVIVAAILIMLYYRHRRQGSHKPSPLHQTNKSSTYIIS